MVLGHIFTVLYAPDNDMVVEKMLA